MSEILLRFNPQTGIVGTVELIADNEKSQLEGLKRLQFYMEEINQFKRKTLARAQLYDILHWNDQDKKCGKNPNKIEQQENPQLLTQCGLV